MSRLRIALLAATVPIAACGGARPDDATAYVRPPAREAEAVWWSNLEITRVPADPTTLPTSPGTTAGAEAVTTTVAVAPPPTTTPQPPCSTLVVIPGYVLFAPLSSALDPAAVQLLADIASSELADADTVSVAGHTDSDGDEHDNDVLSAARAQAVADSIAGALAAQGPPPIDVVALGESQLRVDESAAADIEAAKAENRRVEITATFPCGRARGGR